MDDVKAAIVIDDAHTCRKHRNAAASRMTDPRAQELEPDEMSDVRRSDTDAGIRDLAGRQHGVVAARQLLAAGVPRHAIDFRVERGRLTRLYKGVYRTGAVGAAREPEMAAVLACGESAC
jgi:hypothetical protein